MHLPVKEKQSRDSWWWARYHLQVHPHPLCISKMHKGTIFSDVGRRWWQVWLKSVTISTSHIEWMIFLCEKLNISVLIALHLRESLHDEFLVVGWFPRVNGDLTWVRENPKVHLSSQGNKTVGLRGSGWRWYWWDVTRTSVTNCKVVRIFRDAMRKGSSPSPLAFCGLSS